MSEKKRLISRDPNVDFTRLRTSYTTTDDYQPWDTKLHEANIAMFNAYEDGNYPLCLKFAEAMLAQNYISLAAHFGAYSCYLAQGDHKNLAFHRYVVSGLMHSIIISGDGLSVESPYVTISPAEMRSFLQVRGLTSYRQELVAKPGKHVEQVFVIDSKTQEHKSFFFDNSLALMPRLEHMIKPPKLAPEQPKTPEPEH